MLRKEFSGNKYEAAIVYCLWEPRLPETMRLWMAQSKIEQGTSLQTSQGSVEHNGEMDLEANGLPAEQAQATGPAANMGNDLLTQPEPETRSCRALASRARTRRFSGESV